MASQIEEQSSDGSGTDGSPWRPSSWASLRVQLPLLVSSLVVAVVAALLWISYREVEANLVRTAEAGLRAAAAQVSLLVSQSAQQRVNEGRRAAAHPSVRAVLMNRTPANVEAARDYIARFPATGPQLVELWNAQGDRLIAVALPPNSTGVPPRAAAPSAAGPGELQVSDRGLLFGETVADVVVATEDDTPATGPITIGYLVVRRAMVAESGVNPVSRLVGQDIAIEVGNRDGSVWTDLAREVAVPPLAQLRAGAVEYRTAIGDRQLGVVRDAEGTPWTIFVGRPRSSAVAPARAFLRNMIFVSLGFVGVITLLVVVAASRVTSPLHELTQAAEALAAGNYQRRVAVSRRDEIGRLSATFNTMATRTERAHTELEARVAERTKYLETARAELDRFFSLSPDLFCIAGTDGYFKRVNAVWTTTLGWTEAELTADPYLSFVHPDDRDATAERADHLEDGTSVLNFYNRYRAKDGSYRWLSWKAAPVAESNLVYAVARDVTEQRRLARERDDHAAELAAVNKELEAFTYSVSHDLRAPLRHISGFASMLTESHGPVLDQGGRRHLETIIDAAARMGQLIDDLLAFSRVGRSQLTRRSVSLASLVREVKDEVSASANGRQIAWTLGDLPAVDADPSLLRLVFVNLLSNAVKYTARCDRAAIEVGTGTDDRGDTMVYVRDNGAGFDMQYVDKLFGVFQRLHSNDEFEGVGIGLANVRRIVQRHGGHTWAEGAVGRGATFYFSLPREEGSSRA